MTIGSSIVKGAAVGVFAFIVAVPTAIIITGKFAWKIRKYKKQRRQKQKEREAAVSRGQSPKQTPASFTQQMRSAKSRLHQSVARRSKKPAEPSTRTKTKTTTTAATPSSAHAASAQRPPPSYQDALEQATTPSIYANGRLDSWYVVPLAPAPSAPPAST